MHGSLFLPYSTLKILLIIMHRLANAYSRYSEPLPLIVYGVFEPVQAVTVPSMHVSCILAGLLCSLQDGCCTSSGNCRIATRKGLNRQNHASRGSVPCPDLRTCPQDDYDRPRPPWSLRCQFLPQIAYLRLEAWILIVLKNPIPYRMKSSSFMDKE